MMKLPLTGLPAVLVAACVLLAAAPATADNIEQHMRQACAGLSSIFYLAGPKEDERDIAIAKDMMADMSMGKHLAKARLAGAALSCGEPAGDIMSQLELQAAQYYPDDADKAERFVQIVQCTEAQSQQRGIGSMAHPKQCPETIREYRKRLLGPQQGG